MIALIVFAHTIGGGEGTQPAGILTFQKDGITFGRVHGYIVQIGNAQFVEHLPTGGTNWFVSV